MGDVSVSVTAVRNALFESLEPLTRGVLATVPAEDHEHVLAGLRFALRPHPLPGEAPGARVFVQLEEGPDVARVVTEGLVRDMPTAARLEKALQDVLALSLAALQDSEAAEGALAAAQRGEGHLLVQARPGDGSAVVVLRMTDGRVLVLGALAGEEAATTH